MTASEVEEELEQHAAAVVADFWQLADELMLRFGDGWEYHWGGPHDANAKGAEGAGCNKGAGGGGKGYVTGVAYNSAYNPAQVADTPPTNPRPIAYTDEWLAEVGYGRTSPGESTLWPVEKKAADARFGARSGREGEEER